MSSRHATDTGDPMLKLMTFPAGFGEPSLSPFCVKAMILLDLSGQAWEPEWLMMPPSIGYGKLPILRTPDGPVPDSNFILAWLETQGADLFPGLDAGQRAQAHAIIRMVEEHLRLFLVNDRWVRDDGWAVLEPAVFGAMPRPLRLVVPGLARKGIRKTLQSQGIGKFSDAHAAQAAAADLDVLQQRLGEGPWLFGSRPSAVDAAALPVLSALDKLPGDTPARHALRERGSLMAYVTRGRAQLYPERFRTPTAAAA